MTDSSGGEGPNTADSPIGGISDQRVRSGASKHATVPAVDDRALATALAGGHPDGLLALHDCYADRLYDYGAELLDDPDAAIGAIRDALLVAHELIGTLVTDDRLPIWLYALTRNECVRRRHRLATSADLDAELLVLVRHRVPTADIAVVLGLSADDATHRLRVARATGASAAAEAASGEELPPAPPALREQLIAGAGDDAAEYRAALAHRAGPFGPDGFPQPVDHRRIGGHVLAWCTVAAVLIALAVLVMLPGGDPPSGGTALAALPGGAPASAPELTSAAQPPAGRAATLPLPSASTLHAPATAGEPPAVPATADDATTGPATPLGSRTPSVTMGPPGDGAVPAGGGDSAGQPAGGNASIASWFQNRTAPACESTWAARVHATVFGADPDAVRAIGGAWVDAAGSHPVALRRNGRDWSVTVVGLPTNHEVTLNLRANTSQGQVTGAPLHLLYRCR
jgi:hypothetical protein